MLATRYSVHRIDTWLVDIAIIKLNLACSPAQALNVYAWLVKGFETSTLCCCKDHYVEIYDVDMHKSTIRQFIWLNKWICKNYFAH